MNFRLANSKSVNIFSIGADYPLPVAEAKYKIKPNCLLGEKGTDSRKHGYMDTVVKHAKSTAAPSRYNC